VASTYTPKFDLQSFVHAVPPFSRHTIHVHYPLRQLSFKESFRSGGGNFFTTRVTDLPVGSTGDDILPAGKLEYLCYTFPMPVIRASDIGNYLYCRRAWWYRKQGMESTNQTDLAAGTELHARHGRQVVASSLTRTIGLILLLIALVMLVAYCTAKII